MNFTYLLEFPTKEGILQGKKTLTSLENGVAQVMLASMEITSCVRLACWAVDLVPSELSIERHLFLQTLGIQ